MPSQMVILHGHSKNERHGQYRLCNASWRYWSTGSHKVLKLLAVTLIHCSLVNATRTFFLSSRGLGIISSVSTVSCLSSSITWWTALLVLKENEMGYVTLDTVVRVALIVLLSQFFSESSSIWMHRGIWHCSCQVRSTHSAYAAFRTTVLIKLSECYCLLLFLPVWYLTISAPAQWAWCPFCSQWQMIVMPHRGFLQPNVASQSWWGTCIICIHRVLN